MGQLRFDLKAAILDFSARTGMNLTYEDLASMTGLSVDMLKSLANRPSYNATLKSISQVCSALGSDARNFLTWEHRWIRSDDEQESSEQTFATK